MEDTHEKSKLIKKIKVMVSVLLITQLIKKVKIFSIFHHWSASQKSISLYYDWKNFGFIFFLFNLLMADKHYYSLYSGNDDKVSVSMRRSILRDVH